MTPLPEVGELIGGKYRVLRLLGEGGNGSVFEAENVLTLKRVAIKWLRASQANYEGARERMLREAQSAARVHHPNVVDVYDIGFEPGVVYLVMELLQGETLAELLSSREVPVASLIALLIPALRGVAAAHRSGVIHRDLKPDNLYLTSDEEHPEPRCVVLDFGVAKLSGSTALTTPGTAVGTPIFMPVEQLVGGPLIDGRADVHAVAAILYVALSGRAPYEGETLRDMAMQMLTVEPIPLHQLRPDLPLELCLCIQRGMSKEPSERPASIEALIADLAPYAEPVSEAWGSVRDALTRVVPDDLGTPRSRPIEHAAAMRASPKTPSLDMRGSEPHAAQTPSPAAPTLPPRAAMWRHAWFALVAVLVLLAAVLLWPRTDRAPRALPAPAIVVPQLPEAAPTSAPESPAPQPEELRPAPAEPAPAERRPRKAAKVRARPTRVPGTPRTGRDPHEMSVDEFEIGD